MIQNTHHWTYAQVSLLWELARDDKSIQEISFRVGRPLEEICLKAAELGISLVEPGSAKERGN